MKGTIVAVNGAISLGPNVSLEGRALSTAGAITLDGVTAYTPTGCGSPVLSGPAAPGLASVGCYAVFSGNGSVINAGVSTVTGDVGTNAGLTVGFNPLMVTGTVHTIPDVSTSAAAADLLNVYNYLNLLPHDIELLYPAQFGHNLVLTPHTYLLNAATALTDTLYLNAEGNANAVFVIKITGAFSTSVNANIILTNGTQASNVFWKVDGAVSLNNFSKIKGTFIANNGAVSVNTGVVLDGRALTTNGALSTAAINVAIPSPCTVVPVSWLYFRGKPVNQKSVLVEWGTTTEMNNGFFTVEKSRDGVSFVALSNVNAVSGAVQSVYNYSAVDPQPYKMGYYRLLQTDKDGRKSYFRTIQVKLDNNNTPNTIHYVQANYIYVQTAGEDRAPASIELFSIDGKKIASQKITLTADLSTYKINKELPKGMYLLNVQTRDKKIYTEKVMVF